MKRRLHCTGLRAVCSLLALAHLAANADGRQLLAQQLTPQRGFVDRVYRDKDGDHKYVVFVPAGYTPDRAWPVILYLHSAAERGTDGKRHTAVGLGPYVKARSDAFPFLVVFPQCEDVRSRATGGWLAETPDGRRTLAILDDVADHYRADRGRVILTGWSMGGFGTWSLAAAAPERFSAIVPLAGGGRPQWADRLKNLPVWAFHGADDVVVRPEASRAMISALQAAGAQPRLTEVPQVAHDIWRVAYDSDALYAWMLNPQETGSAGDTLLVRPEHAAPPKLEGPFHPAVVIPQAVYVRLGNRMLETLAYSIPEAVPDSALSGVIDDFVTFTTAEGRQFRVVFSQITYSGEVHRVHVAGHGDGRLNVQLGLKNVTLRIARTTVRGSGRSATAGPIRLIMGSRQPVWLSMLVQPTVEQRRLRLKLVGARFRIPDNNWSVYPPEYVSARGLGMTRDRVSDSLVDGLYASKRRIESEAESIVPMVLEQVEEQLEFGDVTSVVASVWPLPVYKPRVELWPEDVSTDADGVSLVFSAAGAAVDPSRVPESPRVTAPAGLAARRVPRVTDLRVGVAPRMLEALSDLLIEADVMRVNVLDVADDLFAPLSTREALAAAAPDVLRYGDDVDVWCEMILARPFTVADGPTDTPVSNATSEPPQDGGTHSTFRFVAPRVVLSYAIRSEMTGNEWTPYAEFDLHLTQQARPAILRRGHASRALQLQWLGKAAISAQGRFSPNYKPRDPKLNAEHLRALFARGWQLWTASTPASLVTVPDIDFGTTRLRISDVGWAPPHLYAAFSPPAITITNTSTVPLTYETKSPFGSWAGPHTLQPGASQHHDVPHPLVFRRGEEELYSLALGSHSEFRVPAGGGAPRLFEAREESSPHNEVSQPTSHSGRR